MKNEDQWRATKFVENSHGDWFGNRAEIPATSRIITDIVARAYTRAISEHAYGVLVDLGCGAAPLYGAYEACVDEIVCVDWEHSAHAIQHIDIFADLNSEFDIGSGRFDTVIATDVLEHIFDPKVFFRSVSRSMKPNGKLILGTPFLYWIHEAPHDYHRYTEFALRRYVSNAGLDCVSLEPYGGAPEVIADLLSKALGKNRRIGGVVSHILAKMLSLNLVRRKSEQSKHKLPLGYVLVAQKRECTENSSAK